MSCKEVLHYDFSNVVSPERRNAHRWESSSVHRNRPDEHPVWQRDSPADLEPFVASGGSDDLHWIAAVCDRTARHASAPGGTSRRARPLLLHPPLLSHPPARTLFLRG